MSQIAWALVIGAACGAAVAALIAVAAAASWWMHVDWRWFVCFKRPWNARAAYLTIIDSRAEYRCPCGRCDLPVLPPSLTYDETVPPRGNDEIGI